MKITQNNFTSGLNVDKPIDALAEGEVARNRGIKGISTLSARSRDGSTQIYDGAVHSSYYFNGKWVGGVGTNFVELDNAITIISSLTGPSDGEKWSFAVMPPTQGVADYLFLAGAGTLYKIASDLTATDESNWGIEPPDGPPSAADSGAGGNLETGVYKYSITYKNSITGHRSNPNQDGLEQLLLKFDNNLTDTSAIGHTVTDAGAPGNAITFNAAADTPTTGSSHTAVFDGVGAYATIPAYEGFSPSGELFSIDFWLYMTNLPLNPNGDGLLGQYVDANNYFFLALDRNVGDSVCIFDLYIRSGGNVIISYPINLAANLNTAQWYHVALANNYQSGGVTKWAFYLDGVVKHSFTANFTWSFLNAVLQIGYHANQIGSTPNYLDGRLDSIRIVKGDSLFTDTFTPPTTQPAANTVTLAGDNYVNLSNIPQSPDAQVDITEIWRTVVDGSAFFKVSEVSDGTTSYVDNVADADLGTEELPTDNVKPFSWFDECYGPYNFSMFWITRTQSGEKGRLYYSPIGRAESVQGFINISSDDDGLQAIRAFAGNLYVFSKTSVWQVLGTNPYFARKIPGVHGTNAPASPAETPYGIAYEAPDGPRLFNGTSSILIAPGRISRVFRGEAGGQLAAWSSTKTEACFARDEYYLADRAQFIAVNLRTGAWRDIGLIIGGSDTYTGGVHYSPVSDQLAGTIGYTKFCELEDESANDDNGTDITFSLQAPAVDLSGQEGVHILRSLIVDADLDSVANIACDLIYRHLSISLDSSLSTSTNRQTSIIDGIDRIFDHYSIRIGGSVGTAQGIEIFRIEHHLEPFHLELDIEGNIREIPGFVMEDLAGVQFDFDSPSVEANPLHAFLYKHVYTEIDVGGNDYKLAYNISGVSLTNTVNPGPSSRQTNKVDVDFMGNMRYLQLTNTAGDLLQTTAKYYSIRIECYPVRLKVRIRDQHKVIPGLGDFEVVGRLTDTLTSLEFELPEYSDLLAQGETLMLERLFLEHQTDSSTESITPSLVYQGGSVALTAVTSTTTRTSTEWNMAAEANYVRSSTNQRLLRVAFGATWGTTPYVAAFRAELQAYIAKQEY